MYVGHTFTCILILQLSICTCTTTNVKHPTRLLFHLLHNATLEGEHPDTEDQLILQLKCDAAIQ